MDDNIEKRSGRVFGPKIPGKQLVIFIDDLHMPYGKFYFFVKNLNKYQLNSFFQKITVDKYGT